MVARLSTPFLIAVTIVSSTVPRAVHATPTPATDKVDVDLNTAIKRAAEEGRPLFVHFTAQWCQPCRELRETVYPDPIVASRLKRFVRAEIDIESSEGEMSARHYGVQTVPVLMVMTPQGKEIRSLRVVGARTPKQLAAILDQALDRSGPDSVPTP